MTTLGTTEVVSEGGRKLYALAEATDGRLVALPPDDDAVARGDGRPMVRPRPLPFAGYPLPVQILIRESNVVYQGQGGPSIMGVCQYTIHVNGQEAYGPPARPLHHQDALIEAGWAIKRLLTHPVQWWDRASWEQRPIWYRGRAGRIEGYNAATGVATLVPERAGSWGPSLPTVQVHVLADDGVGWTRQVDQPQADFPDLDSTRQARDTTAAVVNDEREGTGDGEESGQQPQG